jgi:hypothetical protein
MLYQLNSDLLVEQGNIEELKKANAKLVQALREAADFAKHRGNIVVTNKYRAIADEFEVK